MRASQQCYIVYIHVIQERLAQTMRTCFELKINERIGTAYVHSTTETIQNPPEHFGPKRSYIPSTGGSPKIAQRICLAMSCYINPSVFSINTDFCSSTAVDRFNMNCLVVVALCFVSAMASVPDGYANGRYAFYGRYAGWYTKIIILTIIITIIIINIYINN